ncbi:MAG: substrate-binding domain-containing protein [Thermoflexales bacterium]|nr:substrate-binding domain-containing protein [Thermoflexales bacterium]
MMKRSSVVAMLVMVGLLAGCAAPAAAPSTSGELKGTITASGAFALYPLMVKWGEEFQKLHPGVQFDISAGGAGKGMTDALAGQADIGMVSREIKADEEKQGAYWVSVTKDAVFGIVNAKNPVLPDLKAKGITRQILIDIYITGKIKTWGEVVGKPEITDEIHVYTRSDAAGAPETWAKYLDNKKQEDLQGVGVFGDPGITDAVAKDPLGLGYNNLGYAYDATSGNPISGIDVLPIDVKADGQVDANETLSTKAQAIAAVAANHYPSPPARALNVVTKGKPSGVVQAFILWTLTDGQQYVDSAGYIPLTKALLDDGVAKLK